MKEITSDTGRAPRNIVDPSIYDKDYFLKDNEGWREWERNIETDLHPKFKRALGLAGPLKGKNILDIGCGRAELVYYCVKQGARACGIDYSPAAIEIAARTIERLPEALRPSARAILGDIGTYDPPDKYDIVFMIEIAEHMHDWQLKEGFEKIDKILSPDGKLIIMTPNYLYEKILSPLKRILNIPGNCIKWPMRILRGRYKPKSFKELAGKIFRVAMDRGELNRKMHVNVTTRETLKRLLSGFDVKIWCEDHSKNALSLLTGHWWGREIIVIAAKKRAIS